MSPLVARFDLAPRRAHRVILAFAVCAGNALLLLALTLAGSSADAEPKPSAEVGSASAAPFAEPFGDSERAQLGKPDSASKEKPPVAKPKSRARKLMPVRDFGGY